MLLYYNMALKQNYTYLTYYNDHHKKGINDDFFEKTEQVFDQCVEAKFNIARLENILICNSQEKLEKLKSAKLQYEEMNVVLEKRIEWRKKNNKDIGDMQKSLDLGKEMITLIVQNMEMLFVKN